jgi:hypothetical protein
MKKDKNNNRKPKIKFDFNKAENAIVDGKLIVSIGEKIVVQRERNEKKQISLCIFKGLEPNGDVTLWDETVSQFYSFNLSDPPIIRIPGEQISEFY